MDAPTENFIHRENLRHLREVLKQTTDAAKRQQILKLLAVEAEAEIKSNPHQN